MMLRRRIGLAFVPFWALSHPAAAADRADVTATQIVGLAAIVAVTGFAWHAIVLLFCTIVRTIWRQR